MTVKNDDFRFEVGDLISYRGNICEIIDIRYGEFGEEYHIYDKHTKLKSWIWEGKADPIA